MSRYDLPTGAPVRVRPIGSLARGTARNLETLPGKVVGHRWKTVEVEFAPDPTSTSTWTLHFTMAGGISAATPDYVLETP